MLQGMDNTTAVGASVAEPKEILRCNRRWFFRIKYPRIKNYFSL